MSEYIEVTVNPIQLFVLKQAIEVELRTQGRMRLTGAITAHAAIKQILEPITLKHYARSTKGKQQALDDVEAILAAIEEQP